MRNKIRVYNHIVLKTVANNFAKKMFLQNYILSIELKNTRFEITESDRKMFKNLLNQYELSESAVDLWEEKK